MVNALYTLPGKSIYGAAHMVARRRALDLDRLGSVIYRHREEAGLTISELGAAIGRSPSAVSQYEHGLREPPLSTLKGIADVLGYPLAALVSEAYPARPAAEDLDRMLSEISQRDSRLAECLRENIIRTHRMTKRSAARKRKQR